MFAFDISSKAIISRAAKRGYLNSNSKPLVSYSNPPQSTAFVPPDYAGCFMRAGQISSIVLEAGPSKQPLYIKSRRVILADAPECRLRLKICEVVFMRS